MVNEISTVHRLVAKSLKYRLCSSSKPFSKSKYPTQDHPIKCTDRITQIAKSCGKTPLQKTFIWRRRPGSCPTTSSGTRTSAPSRGHAPGGSAAATTVSTTATTHSAA